MNTATGEGGYLRGHSPGRQDLSCTVDEPIVRGSIVRTAPHVSYPAPGPTVHGNIDVDLAGTRKIEKTDPLEPTRFCAPIPLNSSLNARAAV